MKLTPYGLHALAVQHVQVHEGGVKPPLTGDPALQTVSGVDSSVILYIN